MKPSELVEAALGKVKADLVVKGGVLVNVYTEELLEGLDVAVKGSRVAYVGSNADHLIGPGTCVLKAEGLYVAPGFMDAHTHIDLYCTPSELAKAALMHGTTSVVAEPDELANVLGFEADVGGVASTLNFDENNLVVLGRRGEDMAMAANRAAELRGGIVVVDHGRIVHELPMPLAGVMSLNSLEEVAGRLRDMNQYLREKGCMLRKPLNVLLFLTFVTLPEARLCPKGLVDVKKRRLTPLLVEAIA